VVAQPVADHPRLRITNGPVLENVGETDATVAWSTSLPSSSIVRYGTDPRNLDQRAEEPWGATTHRVQLKKLRPHTRYFYSVHSAQGKDAPGQVQDTEPQEFRTGGDRGRR
jgi:phosphodiesterase/alkaline phosphatase D-like protein